MLTLDELRSLDNGDRVYDALNRPWIKEGDTWVRQLEVLKFDLTYLFSDELHDHLSPLTRVPHE